MLDINLYNSIKLKVSESILYMKHKIKKYEMKKLKQKNNNNKEKKKVKFYQQNFSSFIQII